jgi:hypothetical protein
MKTPSYQESFEQLENLQRQMKAVLEWKKFKIEERKRNPSFRVPFYDTSVGKLADLKSKFFSDSIRLRNGLEEKNAKLPEDHRNQLIDKLTTLEKQVIYLGGNVRVL